MQALLEVVHDLFEEQTSVQAVVSKIMQRAQTLLNCERCVVMLNKQQPSLSLMSSSSSFSAAAAGQHVFTPSPVRLPQLLLLFSV